MNPMGPVLDLWFRSISLIFNKGFEFVRAGRYITGEGVFGLKIFVAVLALILGFCAHRA